MFRPNSDKCRGIVGLPEPNQNESLHKLNVVMCCQIVAKKFVAGIFGGDQRHGTPVDKIGNFEEKKF